MTMSQGCSVPSEEFLFPILYNYSYPSKLPCVTSRGGKIMSDLLLQAYSHGDKFIQIPKNIGKFVMQFKFKSCQTPHPNEHLLWIWSLTQVCKLSNVTKSYTPIT